MSYQVLARKWRPADFSQMVGQEHVVQALVNALDANRLHHAYLFSGTRGVGKTTLGRIFAKSLNCETGITSRPCGECASCREIDEGRSVDLLEIDAASRTGVDDMRELLENVQYAPTRGRFKIYLIDEVHMLSRHSFNALLKTLEEPPPHIKFLLATTDPQKVPVTVLSRCLQFNLKRMSRAQIEAQLTYLTEQEQIEAEGAALAKLASAADGSMRDGLSLLDQAIAYGAGAVTSTAVESMLGSISRDYLRHLFDALRQQDAAELLRQARAVIELNPDFQRVCAEMISLLHQAMLYHADPGLTDQGEFDQDLLAACASAWSPEELQLYYQILLQGRQDLLLSPDEAAGFEMLMLRLFAFTPETGLDPSPALKKKPESTAAAAAGPATAAAAAHVSPAKSPPAAPVADNDAPLAAPATVREQPPGEPAGAASGSATNGDSRIPEFDWTRLAYELELEGLGREILANSELESRADGRLRIALRPEICDLATAPVIAEIESALARKLGVSLALELVAREELTGETPLQAKQAREERERLAAIAAIRGESVVQKLHHAFAAELDESSVAKIETQGRGET
ncbi:MAG: DNA polymerase III subunit gamma/tau [Gammaproteobacteria bacterium]|nr:DNA polymerase III subunit gamma/tau [Gammaproteobacteria bacterium]